MKLEERFIEYAVIGTNSSEDTGTTPSTPCQLILSHKLCGELRALGIDARCDETGYVYAGIPANTDENIPAVGFIAHVDTSFSVSCDGVRPQIVADYDGGDIPLAADTIRVSEYPFLADLKGKTLITGDGTTLLGADDKAGVAEIMDMARRIMNGEAGKHGYVGIAFTPDEEIGEGADHFDLKAFGCDFAYTVDGGLLGNLEYENFNAAAGVIRINGRNIHPGTAKNKMKNAAEIVTEFHSLLPKLENPACTDGYDGFFHLENIKGEVESAWAKYIIRDHDMKAFERRKRIFAAAADYINEIYGEGTAKAEITDTYFNMRELIERDSMYVVELIKKAMTDCGVTPDVTPIRGGTDGARLTFMGLPCPNICTGGGNFHSRHEFVCVEDMYKISDILLQTVRLTAERRK